MTNCLFSSDLHGSVSRYEKLFAAIIGDRPDAVFLGGDLLPSGLGALIATPSIRLDFLREFIIPGFDEVRKKLGTKYPEVFLILGNDDPRDNEPATLEGEQLGLWNYIHNKRITIGSYDVFGYAYIPPSPFMFKDWERYDVSRYTDPGCVSPEEGWRSVSTSTDELRYSTIKEDLEQLTESADVGNAILLFHTPPYQTKLDRAELDGQMIDHVPLDVHVGSIAVRRFIERCQPLLTLHGHVHESARLTGSWRDSLARTVMFSAAHDGEELALVKFDLENLDQAERVLI